MMKVKGLNKALARVYRIPIHADIAMKKTVKDLSSTGEKMTRNLINGGAPRTGKFNTHTGSNRSAPYEPAKTDHGELASSIAHKIVSKYVGVFGTALDYGVKLELGDGIAPRPFLLPTAFKLQKRASAVLRRNTRNLIK